MTRYPHLDPRPFFLPGGKTGCLLIHGYTGSPPEMRLVGEYLAGQGLTVAAPLLAGHGTDPADLNRCSWRDWTDDAARALAELQARCSQVFVGGLSLGALITLYLGAHHPEIAGLILYSPALIASDKLIHLTPVLKHAIHFWGKGANADGDLTDPEAVKRLWSYENNPTWAAHEVLKLQRIVRRSLREVHQPVLIWHSTRDAAIDPRCGQMAYAGVGSEDKELVTLHNSGHCITVDSEWELVARRTYEFIAARATA